MDQIDLFHKCLTKRKKYKEYKWHKECYNNFITHYYKHIITCTHLYLQVDSIDFLKIKFVIKGLKYLQTVDRLYQLSSQKNSISSWGVSYLQRKLVRELFIHLLHTCQEPLLATMLLGCV